jgi:hypothetical protein
MDSSAMRPLLGNGATAGGLGVPSQISALRPHKSATYGILGAVGHLRKFPRVISGVTADKISHLLRLAIGTSDLARAKLARSGYGSPSRLLDRISREAAKTVAAIRLTCDLFLSVRTGTSSLRSFCRSPVNRARLSVKGVGDLGNS